MANKSAYYISPNDRHHIFWTRRRWGKGDLATLRKYWYCRVSIPRESLHWHIHENVACIPIPKQSSARTVVKKLQDLARRGEISKNDNIERRLELLINLFGYHEPNTVEALRRQLEVVREFYS